MKSDQTETRKSSPRLPAEDCSVERIPSVVRGCLGKLRLKGLKSARNKTRKLAKKYGHQLALYFCPHCKGYHTTTKIENVGKYAEPIVYVSPSPNGGAVVPLGAEERDEGTNEEGANL